VEDEEFQRNDDCCGNYYEENEKNEEKTPYGKAAAATSFRGLLLRW
jgi:hypothetical protein